MIANKTTNKRQKNGSPAFPWGRHTITRAIPTYTKYTAGKTEECGCVAGAQSAHLLLLWKIPSRQLTQNFGVLSGTAVRFYTITQDSCCTHATMDNSSIELCVHCSV